ncbi:prepilin-type N-terminal cleavage/methylation domain-containing protein [Phragmitibacter flavus]|nr:prepilin-type N-terminal cleavage/methylation domain-containing protein [Phragmitibacter flavus]
MKTYHSQRPSRAGFSLLEMMVVMLVLTLLLGAITSIVRGTVQLTDDVSVAQAREARLHGLAQLCERAFWSVPGHGMVRLRNTQAGNRYLSQLTLTGLPPLLAGEGSLDDVIVLETDEAPDGYLRLQMHFLTAEEAETWENGDTTTGTRLLLLENIATLEWRFFNESSRQWEPLWNERLTLPQWMGDTPISSPPGNAEDDSEGGGAESEPAAVNIPDLGRRPGLVELTVAQGAELPRRWTFWVPEAQVPGTE